MTKAGFLLNITTPPQRAMQTVNMAEQVTSVDGDGF
jgi:hypothetical protein